MINEIELKKNGINVLIESLGVLDAERFIMLMQKEKFDYTKWRQDKWENMSIEELSSKAMEIHRQIPD